MSRKITAERDRLKETLNAERARSAKTFREMREEIIDLQSEIRRLKRSEKEMADAATYNHFHFSNQMSRADRAEVELRRRMTTYEWMAYLRDNPKNTRTKPRTTPPTNPEEQ